MGGERMRKIIGFIVITFLVCESVYAIQIGNCTYGGVYTGFREIGYVYDIATCDPPSCDPIASGTFIAERIWPTPDYDWGEKPYSVVNDDDYYAIRWKGVFFGYGTYTFYASTDDGVRGYLDGSLITFSDGTDCWRDKGVSECSVSSSLVEDYHLLVLDYYEQTDYAAARMGWNPGTGKVYPLPDGRFMPQGVRSKVYDSPSQGEFGDLLCWSYENQIDFDWGAGGPCNGSVTEYFAIRFSGAILVPSDGNYSICTQSDDGVRLYLDDQLVIDSWIPQGNTEHCLYDDCNNTIYLTQGPHDFVLEYFERSGAAVVKLGWGSNCDGDTTTFTPIPEKNLVMIAERCGGDEPATEGGGGCSYISDTPGFIIPVMLLIPIMFIIRRRR